MDVFRLIKLLDKLQEFSKEDVVSEYDSSDDEIPDLILNKSIYSNGDLLGFYNYSPYDFAKLKDVPADNIKDEFLDYIDSFSENVYNILNSQNIEEKINAMSGKELHGLLIDLSTENSDDFLTSIYANILTKNNSKISFSSDFANKFKDLEIAIKVKQIKPDIDLSFSNEYGEILDLFNFKQLESTPNSKIIHLAFRDDEQKFIDAVSGNNNSIISVSSEFFDENSKLLNHIINPNYLEAIISLPIYQKDSNLMLIVINSSKDSSNFILIDESESLIHKNDNYDYSFAINELLPNIINSYLTYNEYENGLLLPVSSLISKNEFDKFKSLEKYVVSEDPSKKRVYRTEVDEIISLKEKQASIQNDMLRRKSVGIDGDSVPTMNSSRIEDLMYTRKRQPLENLLYKHEKRLLDEDVKFVNLAEIADLRSISQKNDKDTILVAACKQCKSKLVNYNHDVDDISVDEIYIEIDNISSDILKSYLYVYLNSFNGLDEIKYFSKKNYHITPEQLGYVKIPILKVTTQLDLVDAVRESEEFFKTIDLLKKDFQSNILDYKHVIESINELRGDIDFGEHGDVKLSKSMHHAYSDLIWPLASSYLQATKGGFEIVEKKDNYLVLFEFIAAFNFIILLSGLPDNVYQANKWDIWSKKKINIYKDMSFGKWVILTKNISRVYRENNFTSKLDEELFNKISSNKIQKILEKTKEYRNTEHHGAQSNKYEAEKILEELNVYLDEIFEILEVYSRYKLIYVLESNDLTHKVILLNGAYAPPIYETLKFNEKLENNGLYLYNPRNNKKLLIKDNFMKFEPIDENRKHWALFLYDACDYQEYNAFYKCYQSNEKPLKYSIYDFEEDIIG